MTTTDIRARLDGIRAEHQPEAWEADAFEYSTSGIGCTGCECSECGNVGDFDGPCPTSAMAAALTAVLNLHKKEPARYYGTDLNPHNEHDCQGCGEGKPWPCRTVRTITEHLGGDRG